MSDLENVDILLGTSLRNDEVNDQNDSDINLDSESNRLQQNVNLVGEDFRSLLNTDSRENSGMTIETTRMIRDEITNQVTKKLNEIESSLYSQIYEATRMAIAEKTLPCIQNTLDTQGRANFTVVNQRSSGLQGSPEARNLLKALDNCPKSSSTLRNRKPMSRESSVDSHTREQYRDTKTTALLTES